MSLRPMSKSVLLAALLTSGMGITAFGSVNRVQSGNRVKRCANCGFTHSHNNSFCSAECCRVYRDRKKAVSCGR